MTYSPEEVAVLKEVYLELLAQGKSERQIDVVDGMPSWGTRWQWKHDAAFLTQCRRAKAHGAEETLLQAEQKLAESIMRAEDEACPPQLPPLVKELMSHARWKAKCFNPGAYGDRMQFAGDPDAPIKTENVTLTLTSEDAYKRMLNGDAE
jgi:hypothetical protein